jgi:major type 1 subunit fimbrin (pilin)
VSQSIQQLTGDPAGYSYSFYYLEESMNISIKRALIVAGVTTAMALPLATQASDGTITFTGGVTANTCTVKVNGAGTGDGSVTLPTVSQSALTAVGQKTTAAGTFFHIDVSACVLTTADLAGAVVPTTVKVYFEAGPNVNPLTGGLINTVVGSDVEVNLYNASSAGKANIVTTQIKPGTLPNSANMIDLSTGGSEYFYAGYSTAGTGAAASAGLVSTSVTYSLIYQ